jgi:N-acetylglucosaminyl-diphospho-decaprenol L-rhamnosyltransferase
MSGPPVISFAIVNWKGGSIFERCLASIAAEVEANKDLRCEVVVVDNGSALQEIRFLYKYPFVRVLRNDRNEGYATGTNQSLRACSGEYVFLLNNDVILLSGILRGLHEYMAQHATIGVIAPKLLYPDGRLQRSVRGLPTVSDVFHSLFLLDRFSRRFDHWHHRRFDYDTPSFVEQPMFSALLICAAVWREVGELDEQFPLFFNDVDWFRRFHAMGKWKCLYWPFHTCYHVHGMSTGRRPFRKVLESSTGMYRYFRKHDRLNFIQRLRLFLAIALVSIPRFGIEIVRLVRTQPFVRQ